MNRFKLLWKSLQSLAGLVFPMLARTRDARARNPVVRWALHVVVVATGLVGAIYLNRWIRDILTGPPWLRQVWLPLIFVLLYVGFWVGWLIWKAPGEVPAVSEFTDIDEAWDEAMRALEDAGMELTERPLFLVFGQPGSPGEDLFSASHDRDFELKVSAAPSRPEAPLRLYATQEAIYVACPGAGALARADEILAQKKAKPRGGKGTVPPPKSSERDRGAINLEETIRGGQLDSEVMDIIREAIEQGRSWAELTPDELARLKRVRAEGEQAEPTTLPQSRDHEELERQQARLRHLCRLIVRDRRPYCAVNSLLFLIQLSSTDSDANADLTAQACRDDLTTAIETLQVECPVFALVCGFEKLPGFCEYLGSLPPEMKLQKLGRSFPLLPEFEEKSDLGRGERRSPHKPAKEMIESGMRWVSHTYFPSLIYPLLRIEPPNQGNRTEVVKANLQLVLLLSEIRKRQKHLSDIFVRAFVKDRQRYVMFGGCYLAATGRDPARDQAFIQGVLRHLLAQQNYVSWTPEVLAEERAWNRLAGTGYVVITLLTVLGLAAIATMYLTRS
jgi:hypothetical protein